MKRSYLLALAILLAATGSAAAESYAVPSGVELQTGIAYRPGNDHWKLDIARPSAREGKRPAILLIHGGGWTEGSRLKQRGIACRFAEAGYVAIPIDYRLVGEAPFPACIDDTVAASRWVHLHAADYGIDPDRVGVLAHSAGSLLACMLALAEPAGKFCPDYLPQVSGRVDAVVATSTPTDFIHWQQDHGDPAGLRIFQRVPEAGREALIARCSPVTYVNASAPPILLIHGSDDHTVPPVQSARLITELRDAGAPLAERVVIDGGQHDFILGEETLVVPMELSFFQRTIGQDAGRYRRELDAAHDARPVRNNARRAAAWLVQFDRDHDGFVTRAEFPGGNELFERFDRENNGSRIRLPSPPDTNR